MRVPVVAIGWPSEQPLPSGFTISSSRPSLRTAAIGTDANASLISNRSTSPMPMPALSSALGIAMVGASPVSSGSTPTEAQDRITAIGSMPSRSAKAALVIATAADASFTPEELPAVMLNPSISGCMGLRAASLSMSVPRRGCSSTENVNFSPALLASTAKISSVNAPLSMPATARSWDRRAQASISSRVMPVRRAVFQPTVTVMSRAGVSGVSGWLGDSHISSISPVAGFTRFASGIDEVAWVPPAMITSSMPAMMEPAALATVARPDAQWRFCATPGTLTIPASIAA